MKHKFLLFVFIQFIAFTSLAQKISGVITDSLSNEIVEEAQISYYNQKVYTNNQGVFEIEIVKDAKQQLEIRKENYRPLNIHIDTNSKKLIIQLTPKRKELNVATISGSRFKKRAAEETVSIEVIKPNFIQNNAIAKTDEALSKVPGVEVIDNQINIRGGSGWSYGAGSRVLVMVDDMPLLAADAGDAKWDFLPIENCEQIEILKGAASALYGSSALNGVVNFRTAYATNKPVTKIQLFGGGFGAPARKEMKWWNTDSTRSPYFGGYMFSHAQKIGKTEIVLGSAAYNEHSYLMGDTTRRVRFNINCRRRINERWLIGLNTNIQFSNSSTFFLHETDTTFKRLLMPFGGVNDTNSTINNNRGFRWNIDPNIQYTSKSQWKHNLRTRIYTTQNDVTTGNQSSTANVFYAEYQVMKKIGDSSNLLLRNTNWVAGLVSNRQTVKGDLYGQHQNHNLAAFLQIEKKLIDKIWLSGGMRYESNKTDTLKRESKPVFRVGLNYEPIRGTNIRASFGQGYRYPSVAERYIKTSFGAASVYPNPDLISETGQSSEIGIKQGIALHKWLGYLDVSLFNMHYYDMIEFNFGQIYYNQIYTVGFKSRNIGDTKISGVDLSLTGKGKIGNCNTFLMAGFTYINPTQVIWDSAIQSNYSTNINFLKYRYKYTAKFSYDINYRKWTFGNVNTYFSKMTNIDEVFENNSDTKNIFGYIFNLGTNGLASTIREYRKQYNKPVLISDVRLAYQLNKQYKITFAVKNIFNTEYYIRPALINPTRNYTLQFNAEF